MAKGSFTKYWNKKFKIYRKSTKISLIDLGNDYFIVKLQKEKNMNLILQKGP